MLTYLSSPRLAYNILLVIQNSWNYMIQIGNLKEGMVTKKQQ